MFMENDEIKKEENANDINNDTDNEVKNPTSETIDEEVADLENPNNVEESASSDGAEKPQVKASIRADELDGEINLHNTVTEDAYFKPVNFVYDGFSNIDDEIENVRKGYLAKLKKSKVFNMVAIVVMLIAFVAVILVFFLNKNSTMAWLTYTVLGVSAALIIGSFILTSHFAKKDAKQIHAYLGEYEDTLSGYLLDKMDVENPVLCPDGKVDETAFIQAHCYRTISSIDSRAVLEGTRKGHKLIISEMAAIVPPVSLTKANELPKDFINLDGTPYIEPDLDDTFIGTTELKDKDMTLVDIDLADEANNTKNAEKKAKDIEKGKKNNEGKTNRYGLFGRFYAYDLKVTSDESFILYFMGDREFTNLPDYLTGFKALRVPGLRPNIICYVANPSHSAKFFSEKSVSLLNDIVPNQVVQSLFISVNSFGTRIGVNLSDDIMNVPVKNRQVPASVESYKSANDKIFAFVDNLENIISSEQE